MTVTPWWRDAVVYQIYPRSWADSDGDGIGDLAGITARLPHLVELGVDAVWLSPFYVSPQRDGGYDVADHRAIDPLFGNLEAFDVMINRAHELGLRVVVDVVPNHSSSEHAWFRAALAAPAGSPERARYIFRDGRGAAGDLPPNNWESWFGGPAWSRVTEPKGSRDQWFLHLFDASQPDFDWTNPEVREEMESVLRFWLDRAVDGFRIDVAHGLVKANGLPDAPLPYDQARDATASQPMWDQPGVHEIYRSWRRLVDEYAVPGEDRDRLLCGEAWVEPPEALARYVRPDELHQTFNFSFLMTPWNAAALRDAVSSSLRNAESVGAPQTWVLSNHDVMRHASRLGRPGATERVETDGLGPGDEQPDADLGLRRARAASTVMLALPGSAYVYQGEELGLPDAALPDHALQDPTWERSDHRVRGRDGSRVPMSWEGGSPSSGFGPGATSWLPQPAAYSELAVDQQRGVAGSTFELYKALLGLRKHVRLGVGLLAWTDGYSDDVLAFTVTTPVETITVIANLGDKPIPVPPEACVLISSQHGVSESVIAPDHAVWLRV